MDAPWPAPDADSGATYGLRRPNYRLRRLVVAGGVLALVATVAAVVITRGGDDGGSTQTGAVRGWDTVVLQDPTSKAIRIVDGDGKEIATTRTDLVGLLDVGLDGRIVVGTVGDAAEDGLAALDLDTGALTDLQVSYPQVRRLGDSSLLLASDGLGTGLELVDVATAEVTDLLALTDGVDEPFTTPESVLVDPGHEHVAFTELKSFETYLVTVADGTAVSMPGSLVDLAFDHVLTSTNRGDSALLDLSDLTGKRVGTVEVATPRAAMLVDDSHAIVVTAAGKVLRIDFGDESADDVVDLAPTLPTAPGAAADAELVGGSVRLANHTRLALLGDRFVALLGPDGALVKSVDVAALGTPLFGSDMADLCVVVGAAAGPYTFIDAQTGGIISSFTDATVRGRSADGCTVAVGSGATGNAVVGIGVNAALGHPVVALSDDASSVVVSDSRATQRVEVGSGDTTDLGTGLSLAVFAHR